MSAARVPQIGDTVLFYAKDGDDAESGVIETIWSDSCVNVRLADGATPTSVFLWQNGVKPAGYYCTFAPIVAPVPAPAKFKFGLGATPCITVSGEVGLVVARAEYLNSEPSYLLQYRRNDGVADEQWWRESALT